MATTNKFSLVEDDMFEKFPSCPEIMIAQAEAEIMIHGHGVVAHSYNDFEQV